MKQIPLHLCHEFAFLRNKTISNHCKQKLIFGNTGEQAGKKIVKLQSRFKKKIKSLKTREGTQQYFENNESKKQNKNLNKKLTTKKKFMKKHQEFFDFVVK